MNHTPLFWLAAASALLAGLPFALWLHLASARCARRLVNGLRRRWEVREEAEL